MPDSKPLIAVFISFSGHGGVERMVLNLVKGIKARGYSIELVLVKNIGGHSDSIPSDIPVTSLGAKHTLTSVFRLVHYIKTRKPTVMLAAKDRAIKTAVLARWLSGRKFRLIGRLGTTVSAALKDKSRIRKWFWYQGMKLFYPQMDKIIAVSEGVKKDVLDITGMPSSKMGVIRNPVCTPEMFELSKQTPDHPWFKDSQSPIILSVGRMTRQKDFPTLLKAFALARKERPCRLMILGEGPDREKLQELAEGLGIRSDLVMPGFVSNPYMYLARASLFVLSSLWEGSPNVLTEALALGIPVVSTDCPSGPVEILQNGKYGPLVEMGNVDALAVAIGATLEKSHNPDFLKQSVVEYSVQQSADHYLETLKIPHK